MGLTFSWTSATCTTFNFSGKIPSLKGEVNDEGDRSD